MSNYNYISVCFTPELFHNYEKENILVVVVDILRATSVISTAFEYGIKNIIPVTNLECALKYKNKKKHIVAAERNTRRISGFEYGNSPFHYMNDNIKDKILVLTTTNGTRAIHLASKYPVVTASYININAVYRYIIESNRDIVILCSGWKNLFNLEDTIFAGSLSRLVLSTNKYKTKCDSLIASQTILQKSENNKFNYLSESSYRNRNTTNEIIKDTKFCLEPTITSNIVPILFNEKLNRLEC